MCHVTVHECISVSGKLKDWFGSYNHPFAVTGCMEVLGGLFMLFLFIYHKIAARRKPARPHPKTNGSVRTVCNGNGIHHNENGIVREDTELSELTQIHSSPSC